MIKWDQKKIALGHMIKWDQKKIALRHDDKVGSKEDCFGTL